MFNSFCLELSFYHFCILFIFYLEIGFHSLSILGFVHKYVIVWELSDLVVRFSLVKVVDNILVVVQVGVIAQGSSDRRSMNVSCSNRCSTKIFFWMRDTKVSYSCTPVVSPFFYFRSFCISLVFSVCFKIDYVDLLGFMFVGWNCVIVHLYFWWFRCLISN